MIKHIFVFEPSMNMVEADRYYFRFHSKEVVRFFGPWLRRYETYRAYDAPAEADRFGVLRGRYTELWYDSAESFKEAVPMTRPFTAPRQGWEKFFGLPGGASTIVPAMPTEEFLGKEPIPEEKPILRWVCVFKYPDGVSLEEGEKWYLEVHSQEAKEQPGLLRYVSHRTIQPQPPPLLDLWHRVSELWYEDFASWRKAVVESPAQYTSPPWGKEEPFVDMVSTFVGYKPDVDFLRDNPLIP